MESAFISQEKGSSILRDPTPTLSSVPEHSKSGISSGWGVGGAGELPHEYFLAQIHSLVGKVFSSGGTKCDCSRNFE